MDAQQSKAILIRNKHNEQHQHENALDTFMNAKLIKEQADLQKRLKVEAYLVTFEKTPIATIVIRDTGSVCTAYAKCFINGRVFMFKGVARGVGYDRASAALDGCTFYPPKRERPAFQFKDGGWRWHSKLKDEGFEVWQTL